MPRNYYVQLVNERLLVSIAVLPILVLERSMGGKVSLYVFVNRP